MLVTLFVVGPKEIVHKKEKHGGGMRQQRVQQNKQTKKLQKEWQKEAAKNNIWRQNGKQNQVYMLPKEKPRKENLVSWKQVIAKISFLNQLRMKTNEK